MTVDLQSDWNVLTAKISKRFGMDADLDAILFLIGIQEYGKVPEKLAKDQKMEMMHIAICSLLSDYGYYTYIGNDKDGWPHWDRNKKLPNLSDEEQDRLIKEAILTYFSELA
ncbi:MAG: hypothetical protein JKY42_11510 [Flavobacteriales bacterium]|nr:hypothetical protein [Flavobacteriales bacterium]